MIDAGVFDPQRYGEFAIGLGVEGGGGMPGSGSHALSEDSIGGGENPPEGPGRGSGAAVSGEENGVR